MAGDISATDCATGGSIAVDDSYSCSFEAAFTGNAFDTQTDIVSAVASDDEGNAATASDDATVSLTNVLSSLSVTKTPDPASLPEPGGDVDFTYTVTNDSSVDDVTITILFDSDWASLRRCRLCGRHGARACRDVCVHRDAPGLRFSRRPSPSEPVRRSWPLTTMASPSSTSSPRR